MADQEGFFAKSGKDSVDIAGHKIPIAAIAGVIALVGVILVIRARQNSANVASVGTTPSDLTGFGTTPMPDNSAQLANLSAQLTSLQDSLQSAAPPLASVVPSVAAPAAPAAPAPALQPVFAQPIGVLQIHSGDTPQSLASYWSSHGFPGITAAGLQASNSGTPFAPGNVWDIWRAGQGPSTVVGYH